MNFNQLKQAESNQNSKAGIGALKLGNRVSGGLREPNDRRNKRQSVIGGIGGIGGLVTKTKDFLTSSQLSSGAKDASIYEDELEEDLKQDYGAEALDDLKQLN